MFEWDNEIEPPEDEFWVFSFDRDRTVAAGGVPGPVPGRFLDMINRDTHHEIVAHGNQKLVDEIGIPGREWMMNQIGIESRSDLDMDIDAAHADIDHRLRWTYMCVQVWPDADKYLIVDDVDVQVLEKRDNRIQYFTPTEFFLSFRKYFWWIQAHIRT